MTTRAAAAPEKPHQPVRQFGFSGLRGEIIKQVLAFDFPAVLGPAAAVRGMVVDVIPAGDTWRGSVTVSGYHTPPNPDGTGTVYLCVSWKAER